MLYTAVISTAFDLQADIIFCSIFQSEKDAVESVIKMAVQEDLITRSRFIEIMVEEEYDDEYIERISEMSEENFKDMVISEVQSNPTIDNLKDICENYSKEYSHEWDFLILRHM